jgi:glycosyltransferase involved in cell wall biosynthesis
LAIVNSKASARVLELMWGYDGETRVCLNALRPSLMPAEPVAKPFPSARPIRLGVAARLMPVKGIASIIYAVAELRSTNMDVELHVAGTGAERERLGALVATLGLDRQVRFHGLIDDMRAFYRDVDCLLHVPLTEAFGLVTIEAAAQGCPAIVAAIDGLPEAVEHAVSGRCLNPTLALTDYKGIAGSDYGIPERIYDPVRDELVPPKAVDPVVLAEAVRALFAAPAEYERLSRSASEHVLSERRFDHHVDDVMTVISEFAAR